MIYILSFFNNLFVALASTLTLFGEYLSPNSCRSMVVVCPPAFVGRFHMFTYSLVPRLTDHSMYSWFWAGEKKILQEGSCSEMPKDSWCTICAIDGWSTQTTGSQRKSGELSLQKQNRRELPDFQQQDGLMLPSTIRQYGFL